METVKVCFAAEGRTGGEKNRLKRVRNKKGEKERKTLNEGTARLL